MADKESEEEAEPALDIPAVREAAKWLLTAFAGVGAVLVGGLQFSSLGKLQGGLIFLALFGVVLALSGILIAIWKTSNVLVTRVSSIAALSSDNTARKYLEEHRDIVGREFQDLDDFIQQRQVAWAAYKSLEAGRPDGLSDDEWTRREGDFKKKRNLLAHYEKVADRVTKFWRFERVCMAFESARRKSFLGAVMATIGIALFAYATNADESSPFVDSPSAVAVTYTLTDTGLRLLLEQVSADCLPRTGDATVLDGWPKGTDVIIPSESLQCRPLRLHWNDQLGVLQARQPPPVTPLSP